MQKIFNQIQKVFNQFQLHLFISEKYFKARRRSGKRNFIFFSLFAGISGGLAILIVVLGVMNGFQYNHISRRIEIGSYHLTVKKKAFQPFQLNELKMIKKDLYQQFSEINALIPFVDREVIIHIKKHAQKQIVKLRAIDSEEIKKDVKFLNFFQITKGELNLSDYHILLGNELGKRLNLKNGGTVYVTPDISLRSLKASGVPFHISGMYMTGNYEYDRYGAYISTDSLIPLTGKAEVDYLGIKLNPRVKRNQFVKHIQNYLGDQYQVETAEQINKGYFAALKLEKIMMLFIFFIIFIMAATNTFGALKLTIIQKKHDISVLKAIGLKPEDIKVVFIMDSLFLGFGGSICGLVFGLFIAYNITNIFNIVEFIINSCLLYVNYLINTFFPEFQFKKIVLYNADIYYQSGFLVKMNFYEVISISFLILMMTFFAAYIPVSKAAKVKPNAVLTKTNI
ncbi:MAG: ABC transporter permease [Spirochaetes bacterium]|nr:ABC transporter permease [Spirochaetota bacterium]